ncbi:MAG: phenylalanine--tRNA ligase beta subunit-related protein [Lachnospiraceae bacterium]|nr:phenylalanine--tRNA ligase beta subunit-related protein [Lachnospiraceae bacterium]
MNYDVKIDPQLYETCPDIRLGLMRFHTIVKDSNDDFWDYMNKDVLPRIRSSIDGKEWNEIPGICGSRAVYKAFGRNPGRYRVSSEALLRRIRRGDELYHINSVVDVNNLISVVSGLSVGSYDLKKINGPIIFRKATKGEGYTGIGKDFLDMENMLILADDDGIFGSSMSDSTRAMVTADATDILVVVYCFDKEINLIKLLEEGKVAFEQYANVNDAECWII